MSAPRRVWLDGARVLALCLAVASHGVWIASLAANAGTAELERRDYRVFVEAGARLRDGSLYAPRPGGFPFLHPPPVAALSLPLEALAPLHVYALIVALDVAGLALFVLALRRLRPDRAAELDVVALASLASAPWLIALVVGQPAALPLAAWTLGLALLVPRSDARPADRRALLGGMVFALCALKPPLLIGPLAFVALRRERRATLGLAVGIALLVALSLPLGLARWSEWLDAIVRVPTSELALFKQHTLLATLRATLPPSLAWTLWALALLGLGASTLHAARRREPLRAVAALALATLALGPYAYYYDALLLALPASILWLARDRYAPRWRVPLATVATATALAQPLAFFVLRERAPPILGAFTTAWLALEMLAPVPDLRDLGSSVPGPRPLDRSP